MNENEKNSTTVPETNDTTTDSPEVTETSAPESESTTETAAEAPAPTTTTEKVAEEVDEMVANTSDSKRKLFTVAAVVIVVAIFIAIFYAMEKDGRSNTGVFDGIESYLMKNKTVATVNGVEITGQDLGVSTAQINAGAAAQGANIEDPQVKSQIETQALEVLINTELLKQEAADRNIEIPQEEVQARYDELVASVGGEEVLEERMEGFGIDQEMLMRDINTELVIQALLDELFLNEDISVSEEEIVEMYESYGGEAAGLPPIEEVRAQFEQQIAAAKEQEIVSNYIETLRADAEIETSL